MGPVEMSPWGWIWLMGIGCASVLPGASAQIIGGAGAGQLNILFAIEGGAIFVVVVGLFFIWNRLLGVCTGYILRKLLWKSSCIWISIDSIQFSPLAGKILFKNLRYHSSNMSIRVLTGHVSWRYWKWIVREEGSSEKRPCRTSVNLEGLEWFLYNRTPAFDAIVNRMQNAAMAENTAEGQRDSEDRSGSASSQSRGYKGGGDLGRAVTLEDVLDIKPKWRMPWKRRKDHTAAQGQEHREQDIAELRRQVTNATSTGESVRDPRPLIPPVPREEKLRARALRDRTGPEPPEAIWQWQRDVFPIEIIVSTGAVVIGSDATPTVTIMEFQYAKGYNQTTECPSKWDLYRQVADFRISDVKVLVRTNPDYTGSLLDHGKKAHEELVKQDTAFNSLDPAVFTPRAAFHAVSRKFIFLASPYFSKPPTYGAGYYGPNLEWRGLARYRADEPGLSSTALQADYAKVTTLLDTPELELSYFTDVPGAVPQLRHQEPRYSRGDPASLGNGDAPPEWGIDCVVFGGTLTYGPWADRQRAAFMKAFLPSIFYHSSPTEAQRPGETRMHTEMRVLVELRNATTLRMPTREASKDWLFQDIVKLQKTHRKYGWLDVVVGPHSTIRYNMPIVAMDYGYNSIMQMHLDKLSVRSSVNYEPFLNAKSCRLFAQMPAPLQWDARRDWTFDLAMDHITTRILRDHITLIGDLAKDWSTGPTGDFHHFVPFDYQFNVTLSNYEIRLFLNDFNIIDSPQADEANSFLNIRGPKLSANVEIPLIRYRPESSTIPFTVDAHSVTLDMSVPIWHTHYTFAEDAGKTLATIKSVHVRGTYLYYAGVSPEHIETLNMIIQVDCPRLHLFGWAIRRLLLLRDNYFGSYTGYRTVTEFMESYNKTPPEWGDPIERKYRPNKSDTFEVNLDVAVTGGLVSVPNGLFSFEESLLVKIPGLDVHLRSHEASLELMVTGGIIGLDVSRNAAADFASIDTSLPSTILRSGLRLDGLGIRAHRLFGPAPRTSTYLCLWEIALDRIGGQVSPEMLGIGGGAMSAFAYLYADEANAPLPVYQPPVDPDITFLNAHVASIEIVALGKQSRRLRCSMRHGIQLSTTTTITRRTTSRQKVVLKHLGVQVLTESSSSASRRDYAEVATLESSVILDIFKCEDHLPQKAAAQLAFVRAQDGRSRRISSLYGMTSEAAKRQGPYSLPISISNSKPVNKGIDGGDRILLRKQTMSFAAALPGPDAAPAKHFKAVIGRNTAANFTPQGVRALLQIKGDLSDRTGGPLGSLDTAIIGQRSAFRAKRPMRIAITSTDITIPSLSVTATQPLPSLIPPRQGFVPSALISSLHIGHISIRTASGATGGLHHGAAAARDISVSTESRYTAHNVTSMPLGLAPVTASQQHGYTLVRRTECNYTHGPDGRISFTARLTGLDFVAEPILTILWPAAMEWRLPTATAPPETAHSNLTTLLSLAFDSGAVRLGDPAYLVMSYPTLQTPFAERHPGDGSESLRDDPGWQVLHRLLHINGGTVHLPRSPSPEGKPQTARPGSSHKRIVDGILAWRGYQFDRGDIDRLAFLQPVAEEGQTSLLPERDGTPTLLPDFSLSLDEVRFSLSVRPETIQCILWLGHLAVDAGQSADSAFSSDTQRLGLALGDLTVSLTQEFQEILVDLLTRAKQTASPKTASLLTKESKTPRTTRPGRLRLFGTAHLYRLRFSVGADSLQASLRIADAVPVVHADLPCALGSWLAGVGVAAHSVNSAQIVSIEMFGSCALISLELYSLPSADDITTGKPMIHVDLKDMSYCSSIVSATQSSVASMRTAVKLGQLGVGSTRTPPVLWEQVDHWLKRNHNVMMTRFELLRGNKSPPPAPAKANHAESVLQNLLPLVASASLEVVGCDINVQIAEAVAAFWTLAPTKIRGRTKLEPDAVWNAVVDAVLGAQTVGFSKATAGTGKYPRRLDDDTLIRVPHALVDIESQLTGQAVLLKGAVTVDGLEGTFKPSVLDRLLSIYKGIGSELRTIKKLSAEFDVVADPRDASLSLEEISRAPSLRRTYMLDVRSKGVRITLMGSQSFAAVVLEANAITGGIVHLEADGGQYDTEWSAQVSALQVSLGHLSALTAPAKGARGDVDVSSYMVVDLACKQHPPARRPGEVDVIALQAEMRNVHCVMQVAAIAELYDLFSTWISDLETLRQRRLDEWNDMIAGTGRLIRPEKPKAEAEDSGPRYIDKVVMDVTLTSLAVAMPLRLAPLEGDSTSLERCFPALLFSISDIVALNSQGQTGKIDMANLLIQFVPLFDRARKEHFEGLHHASWNRMLLPLASIKARHEIGQTSRHVWITGTFDDFETRIDVDIVVYCKLLLRIYSQGKARIETFTQNLPLDGSNLLVTMEGPAAPATSPREGKLDRTLQIQSALHFRSGTVHLGRSGETDIRRRQHPSASYDAKRESMDSLKLPGVALWVQYRERSAREAFGGGREQRQLLKFLDIGLVIEASANVLRPSIIAFVDGVMSNAKIKATDDTAGNAVAPTSVLPENDPSTASAADRQTPDSAKATQPMQDIEMHFSLRIDKSRLTLICAPDSEVMAELAWETGGLTVQQIPGVVELAISGSVSDVAVNVRHAYLSNQDSLYGALHGLTASAVIAAGDQMPCQVVAETSLNVRAKLGRIQDLLCLKAVWLDNLSRWDVSDASTHGASDERAVQAQGLRVTRQSDYSATRPKVVVVRAKQVDIGVDLALTRMTLHIEPVLLRANLSKDSKGQKVGQIDLELSAFNFSSEGALAGEIRNPRVAIHSFRAARAENTASEMMRLKIEADVLTILIDHEGQGVLRLELEPCLIHLHDKWGNGTVDNGPSQAVDLDFQINLGTIDSVMCLFALPGLLDTAERIYGVWERQVETAETESAAYRAHLRNKPADTATAVARVLQDRVHHSDAYKMDSSVLKIVQDMGLTTSKSRFGICMGSLEDETAYLMESAEMRFGLARDRPDAGHYHRAFRGKLTGTRLRRWTTRVNRAQISKTVNAKARLDRIMQGAAIKVINLPDTTLAMTSMEALNERELSFDYDIDYKDALTVEFQMGVFVEIQGAWRILQDMRGSRLAPVKPIRSNATSQEASAATAQPDNSPGKPLTYRPKKVKLALPGMNVVGDTANDILAPYTGKYTAQAPQATHEYLIKPLEKGMDILLHIYEEMLDK